MPFFTFFSKPSVFKLVLRVAGFILFNYSVWQYVFNEFICFIKKPRRTLKSPDAMIYDNL